MHDPSSLPDGGAPQPPLPSWKKLIYAAISTCAVLLALAIAAEIGLRVFVLMVPSFRSAAFRQYDPVLGESLIPNAKVVHSRGCFSGLVETNRWGFRDRDRTMEKPPRTFRIAILGDSVVEAAQVQPGEPMNIQLEKLLAANGYANVEALAFGIAGIGTTQELMLYQEKARQFHPDVVVVVFVDNDIMNNSSTLQPRAYGVRTWYAPYYNLGPGGNLVFQPVAPEPFRALREFGEKHILLAYYLEHIYNERVNWGAGKWEGLPVEWQVYQSPPDAEWSAAWRVTGKVLKRMQEAVESDGAKFLVVKTPTFSDIDPDWRARFTAKVGKIPADFDPGTVQRELEGISTREQIPVVFMAPVMQAYRDSHGLRFPYFSWTCETHFSPLGHEVAAEAIYDGLETHGMLPGQAPH